MLFTTLTYVLFLGAIFAVYWSVASHRRLQNALLLAGGYVFYGWWDWRFCSLMLFSSAWDFGAAHLLARSSALASRRAILAAGVGVNLAILGFFKYWNFFAENLQALAHTVGLSVSPALLSVILPVGISFYTFQSISYLIDVYRRQAEPCRSPLDYFTFVAFFPQLMAGPIERAHHMLPQFAAPRRFDAARATDGCRQILWGFFKKLTIADQLAPIADLYFGSPASATGGQLLVATLAFTFQIYCDFSAYSDIALGSARLLGIDLMRNFDRPYFATSPQDFWRRWHISLSTWFRDYVYIPLGGSRTSAPRRALNLLVTFLVSGLWHGASWNFVIWGGIHGLAVMPSALLKKSSGAPAQRSLWLAASGLVGTFALVAFAWIFFRAATVSDSFLILQKIALAPLSGADEAFAASRLGTKVVALVASLMLVEWWQRRRAHPLDIAHWPRLLRWAVYLLLVAVTLLWGTHRSGQFIYFQF